MARLTNEDHEAGFIELPEDTILRGRVQKIEEKPLSWVDKQSGEKKTSQVFEISWRIQGGDYDGARARQTVDAFLSSHERNRLRLTAEALLQTPIGIGQELDTDELIGLEADITIKRRRGTGKHADKVFHDVEDVMVIGTGEDVPF